MGLKVFFMLTFILSANSLELSDECLNLNGKSIRWSLECTTASGLRIREILEGSQKFYCINYEKKTGNIDEFDILAFDLSHDDYDLKFVSVNISLIIAEIKYDSHTLDWFKYYQQRSNESKIQTIQLKKKR